MNNHLLTPDEVKALRTLTTRTTGLGHTISLVADYRRDYGWALTIIEDQTMPEGYEPRHVSRRQRIMVNGRNEVYHVGEINSPARLVASGNAWGATAARALGNLVKPNDVIYVRFYIGNNTERMTAAGFSHDQCHLEVWRGAKTEPDGRVNLDRGKLISVMALDDRVYANDCYRGGSMCDYSYQPERDGNVA